MFPTWPIHDYGSRFRFATGDEESCTKHDKMADRDQRADANEAYYLTSVGADLKMAEVVDLQLWNHDEHTAEYI